MRRRRSYQPTAIRSPKPKTSRKPQCWASWLTGCSFLVVGGSLWLDGGIGRAQYLAQIANQDAAASPVKILSVNSSIGNDTTGNGTERQPFKTITSALRQAGQNTVILLAPGTYSTSSGETFPLLLKAGVTIEGNPRTRGQDILIKGGGVFCGGSLSEQTLNVDGGSYEQNPLSCTTARQNVTIVGATHAGLTGVTVTNPNQQGYGLWIESSSPVVIDNTFTGNTQDGILVSGNSVPLIRSNYLYANGVGGIAISGSSRPDIRENVLSNTALGISITQNAAPRLMGNRISNNKDGVVVEGNAQPVLRNNIIINNEQDGLLAIASSRPNLGTAAEPGGNTFRSNGRFDISNKAANDLVAAFGNQLGTRTEGLSNLTGRSSVVGGNPSSPVMERVETRNSVSLPQQPTTTTSLPSGVPNRSLVIPAASSPISAASRSPVTPISTASSQSQVANRQPASNPPASQGQQETPLQIFSLTSLSNSSVVKPPSDSSQPSVVSGNSDNGQGTTLNGAQIQVPSISASSFPVPTGLSAQTPVVSGNGQPIPPSVSSLSTESVTAESRQPTPEVGRQITFERPVPPPATGSHISSNRPLSSPHAISQLPVLTPSPLSSDRQEDNQTANLSPTPSQNISMGNTSNTAAQASSPKLEPQAQGKKPTSSVSLSSRELRYRVVVEANSDQQKAMVRSLVPDAFHTVLKGHSVMQVGAYSDRAYAEQMLQMLKSKGLRAAIVDHLN